MADAAIAVVDDAPAGIDEVGEAQGLHGAIMFGSFSRMAPVQAGTQHGQHCGDKADHAVRPSRRSGKVVVS